MLIENIVKQAEETLAPNGYRLGQIVGVGGMGIVYALHSLHDFDTDTDTDLVIKFVHPRFEQCSVAVQQLQHEAQIELSLSGLPQIVQTVRCGITPKGQVYKIMQRLQGQSLKRYLMQTTSIVKTDKVVPLKIWALLTQAITSIHAQGIIHGDIKPSNIFISATGEITLFDFGLAQRIGEKNPPAYRAYSPRYASPAILAAKPLCKKDDLYSLSLIRAELGLQGVGLD